MSFHPVHYNSRILFNFTNYFDVHNAIIIYMEVFFFNKNHDLCIFRFMHEFWTIHIVNMMYNTSQNYTNMMVGEHGIQTFEVVIVVFI